MDITENKMLIFIFVTLIMCCLIFLYKLIKSIINCIRYFKCRNKYKNLIPNYMQQCRELEQSLQKKGAKDGIKQS